MSFSFSTSNQLLKAYAFAMHHHVEARKGTDIPYISHLMGVASLVLEFGGSEEEAIAALLHDVVEDTDVEIDEVQTLFGDIVADIVAGCSEKKHDIGEVIERPWKVRKDEYVSHALAVETSSSILLVSMADKLHNVCSMINDYRRIGDDLWGRFNPGAGINGTLWFYRSLADGFLQHANANKDLARELNVSVSELESLVKPH